MKLRFTPQATEELAAIADYLRERHPVAAKHVCADILNAICNLSLFPELGRIQETENVRKLVTPAYAYMVYYRVDEAMEEVAVLSIHHAARKREYRDA